MHGDAVRALEDASNAMSSAASASREADRMLAADRAGKRLSNYDQVKAEVARQLGYAQDAARAAQVAAAQAKAQADVLVQTGLEHGVQWSKVASGIAAAGDAAWKAGQRHQAQESRARATEAMAASGRGTIHAAEARAAADAARADTAGTVAGQARSGGRTPCGVARQCQTRQNGCPAGSAKMRQLLFPSPSSSSVAPRLRTSS